MFFPEGQIRVHVYGQPVDMRKSYDGLYALTRQVLGQNPLSGRLFVFINRRATQMKVLYWDRMDSVAGPSDSNRGGFCPTGARLRPARWTGPGSNYCSKASKRKSSESAINTRARVMPTV